MKNLFYTLTLIAAASIWSCSDDDTSPSNPTGEYTTAEEFFTALNYQGSVIISKNGSEVLSKGFGKANLETEEMNDVHTKFRLASVSKTITSMGVVQLKRDGLIESFDQKLSDFDDEFPNGDQISIRQLLTHQSGIPDYVGGIEPLAKDGQDFSAEEIYEVIKEEIEENGLDFTPGSSLSYSNSNFLIAALLIELLTEDSYETYIQQNILTPLGLNETEMGQDEISAEGYAHGYSGNTDVSAYPMEIALGAGSWTSTASDMMKWCEAVMGNNWLTEAEKSEIFQGEVPAESTLFGMGWFKSNISGKLYYWHGGDIDGFTTMIGFIPESEGVIVTLSNQEDATGNTRAAIIETLLKEEF